ncbi:hypothetical protein pdam_00022122, partial [Pocillopora damicornis]
MPLKIDCAWARVFLRETKSLSKTEGIPGARKGPLTELNTNVKRQRQREPKVTKRKLKSIGEAIYATYNEKCQENFQKSLSDILVLVPEAVLQKKSSPTEEKKIRRNEQRQSKKELESKMSQNDGAVHLSLRQSYSSRQVQRMALSYETFEEAKERAKTTPPK